MLTRIYFPVELFYIDDNKFVLILTFFLNVDAHTYADTCYANKTRLSLYIKENIVFVRILYCAKLRSTKNNSTQCKRQINRINSNHLIDNINKMLITFYI